MNDNEIQNIAKESPAAEEQKAGASINNGVLKVEIPLFMPNGEFIAYGMLHKAQLMAAAFYRTIEREAQQKRILTPAGVPPLGH